MMAPALSLRLSQLTSSLSLARRNEKTFGDWRLHAAPEALILEAWSQGVLLGALMIMICITVANLRRGVILHKLILIELFLAILHGTFCLMSFNGYGWYLSSTAALLYCSYVLHNFVAWIKIKPFFINQRGSFFGPRTCRWVPRIYLTTLFMTIPPIILQIFNNFRYFNNISLLYIKVRPYEPLMRDPWWVSTNIVLLHVIRKSYSTGVFALIKHSPRLGILIAAICLALTFTTMDFCTSVIPGLSLTDGINPYWKLSLVFKCLTDSIMLDDFKTELDKLSSSARKTPEKRRKRGSATSNKEFTSHPSETEHAEYMGGFSNSVNLERVLPTSDELSDLQRQQRPLLGKPIQGRTGREIMSLPSLGIDSALPNGASE